jgi:hypothetical protein
MSGIAVKSGLPGGIGRGIAEGKDNRTGYRLIMFVWFLFLFEPARLAAHYVPALFPLRWLPTALLLTAFAYWIAFARKKYHYGWFAAFVGVNLAGTAVAYFGGNWGIAREINRQILQFFFLGLITFSYVDNEKRIARLLAMYFWHILYFALWGLLSLKLEPIDPAIDPGVRKIVFWHPWLDNRDGFGALMVIGIAFSWHYLQAGAGLRKKAAILSCLLLCFAGVVMSFGRGVFLATAVTAVFILFQSKKKIAGLLILAVSTAAMAGISSFISPENLYWEKMSTIESGMSAGTGADRKNLWSWAWREFLENPVLGVGTGNFGIAALEIVSEEEMIEAGYTRGRLWGRSLHCAPLTILCEYGLVGVSVFIFFVSDFIRTNRMSRRSLAARKKEEIPAEWSNPGLLFCFQSGLAAAFVAFWVNGIFYEIIYAPFLWNIVVLSRLIHLRSRRADNVHSLSSASSAA